MKTVVITGAFGFLGRHASRLLAREGFRVVGLGHGIWPREEWQRWGLSAWFQGEITRESLKTCAAAPYAIIHLAGGSSVQKSVVHPFGDFERSVATTVCVLEYIRVVSPGTMLVYASSAAVYGNANRMPIPEHCTAGAVSPYGLFKCLSEQVIKMYGNQYRVAASIVRFFSVYGCGLRKQLLWDACNKMAAGQSSFMGTGRELRDWLHIDDAVNLIKIAVNQAGVDCPIVNGGTGIGVSVREILEGIASHFPGVEPKFLGVQRIGDPEALVADATLSRAWGWEPRRSLEAGLGEYVAWWQSDCALSGGVPRTSNVEALQTSATTAS